MKRLEFTINAKKEDNIMYHFFPIEVGEDIGRIELFYDFYPERVKGEAWVNEVGICLKDPDGVDVGTRGRKKEKIQVEKAMKAYEKELQKQMEMEALGDELDFLDDDLPFD